MTPPTVGCGTVIFCGHCDAEIEEIFWAEGQNLVAFHPTFATLRDHIRAAGHDVSSVHVHPFEIHYHNF